MKRDLRRGIERPGEPWRPDDHEYTLFGDTIEELSGRYCFTKQYSEDQERWRQQAEANCARSQRLENPFKGVGRNDPCPCGSGKKFKKCCLATVRLGSMTPEVAFPGESRDWMVH
jgi:SEC-C motif